MRGAPAWQGQHLVAHPSTVSALRADPPSPTRGEGRGAGALQSQTGERCNEAASGGEVGI
ncbi:hypothetical protein EN794_026160 [Mesorhizobium sp. M00.F.Ca.ET.151.01.1.1]|nr:hypothetical protein EN794_026160 [Mesorhizobium sp. M00.F.Ca.ET.151.01.1.1]